MRKLKRRAQELHGYWRVTYNSRGPKHHMFDPFTGEDYGFRRHHYKLRVTTTPRQAWRAP